jgi:hypothetical protein
MKGDGATPLATQGLEIWNAISIPTAPTNHLSDPKASVASLLSLQTGVQDRELPVTGYSGHGALTALAG